MATIVKNWANGDPLTLETSAGGISVLSAPNLTGSDREMDITVRTTNNGVKASKVVSIVQGKRDYMSWWEDASGAKHYFDLSNTPIANFCSTGDATTAIMINGESVIKGDIIRISFGEGYLGVTEIPGLFLVFLSSLIYADIAGLRNAEAIGLSFMAYSAVEGLDLSMFKNLHAIAGTFLLYSSIKSIDVSGCINLNVIGASFLQYTAISNADLAGCINLETIYASFLTACPDLRTAVLPKSVTNIGAYLGGASRKLDSLTVHAPIPPTLGADAFIQSEPPESIYVPSESVELYKNATNWNAFASKIKPL